MKTVPARGAADPARDAADKEPPTVLLGALKVKVPNGDTLVLQTTFDTGSDTDAISETVATKLRELGVAWGEAGGGVRMAARGRRNLPLRISYSGCEATVERTGCKADLCRLQAH